MYWWFFGIILAFFVVRSMWRAYIHPSHVLGRQAANMNWVAIGRVSDSDGYKNVKLARDGMEAVISFQNGNVELVKHWHATPFRDFIELERWLATEEQESTDDEEVKYYEAVNNFINSHGFYESFLALQGIDEEYCVTSMKMHKAGYLSGRSEKVIGALTMDSVKKYEQNRQLSILFLQKLEEQFFSNQREDGNSTHTPTPDEDVDYYHPALDKATREAGLFLERNNMYVPARGNGRALNISSELLVYIASYLAMLNSGENIAATSWNSFKSSIENRILATIENSPSLSETIVMPESTAFVHYTSEYFTEMTRMEDLVLNYRGESGEVALQPLVSYFLRTLGSSNPEHQSQFQKYLFQITEFASREIVPKVMRVFG